MTTTTLLPTRSLWTIWDRASGQHRAFATERDHLDLAFPKPWPAHFEAVEYLLPARAQDPSAALSHAWESGYAQAQEEMHRHLRHPPQTVKVNIIETEVGWGQRINSVREFATLGEAEAFIKEFNTRSTATKALARLQR